MVIWMVWNVLVDVRENFSYHLLLFMIPFFIGRIEIAIDVSVVCPLIVGHKMLQAEKFSKNLILINPLLLSRFFSNILSKMRGRPIHIPIVLIVILGPSMQKILVWPMTTCVSLMIFRIIIIFKIFLLIIFNLSFISPF